ncbi:MAG: hypothetical protein ACRDO7_09955 [Nocardioidaceae bacterium]
MIAVSGDETVQVQASDLDSAPVGQELRRADYLLLAVLGIAIPVALLIWGWL